MTGKDPLQFQDPLHTYTQQTTHAHVPPPTSVPSPAQASSKIVTAQLPGNSTTDDLHVAI